MASFFRPHHYYNVPEPNFQGLFRLIDDFDRYSNQAVPAGSNGQGRQGGSRGNVPFFTPKFDMTETETAYELHGELPGLAKEDVHIEFTDPQTLQIRGKVERTHTAGTPPAGLLESGNSSSSGAGGSGDDHAEETSSVKSQSSHHATVEDDPEEEKASHQSTPQDTPASSTTTAVQTANKPELPSKPAAPKHKYYLVERNIGSFARSFNFPTRVDNESVQASLKDGVLTVIVQKAKKHESRRIAIN